MPKTPEEIEAEKAKKAEDAKAKKEAADAAKKETQGDFVSKGDFDEFKETVESGMGAILKHLEEGAKVAPAPVVAGAQASAPLGSKYPEEFGAQDTMVEFNPRYDAKARQVLGDKLDRTFVEFPSGGGTLFTIVIKREHSNAPQEYLEYYKEDRRTVNVEREEFRGEGGAEKWAKLVLQNLNKAK